MTQPTCRMCGATEITHTHAAARGWRMVRSRMYCTTCVRRFPVWMSKRF